MANIYFKHLSLTNFMSYESAEIDLNRVGNILVGGINNNPEDNAKSNGCGKSSLFSALSWCLTGETISGAKDISNIYLSGTTKVSVTFDLDNNSYEIIRTKNPSNLFIYINGENNSVKGIRDTSELLVKYIPQLSSSLINSVIILGQGLPQKFTNNSPSGRKEILEKLSNSDFMITDLKEKLSARKNYILDKQRILQDDNLTISTSIKINKDNINLLNKELSNLEDKESLILSINTINLKLNNISQDIEEFDEFDESLKVLLEDKNKEYDSVNSNYKASLNLIDKIDVSSKESILFDLKSEYRSLDRKIKELEAVTDVCPTCGQKLPNVVKFDTSSLKTELEEKFLSIKSVEKEIDDINKINIDNVNKCENLFNEKLIQLKNDIKIIQDDINKNNIKLQDLRQLKIETEKEKIFIENKLNSLEENIAYRKNKICELETTNNILDRKITNNNEKLDVLEERLSINSKMQTLVKRDFRGYLLNNIISFIENQAKKYSLIVFGTDKLSFKLNSNNIDIAYDNKDYSVLSGGEKQKIDIIIQFAIRDMLCTFLDFSSNILVLDEITDSLDSIGVSNIFNLINTELNDVEVVYIISHHSDELEIPSDDEIIIIKGEDKISRIV